MIRIVQGNDVNIHVPLMEKNADGTTTPIDFANISELKVRLSRGSEAFNDFTIYTANNTVVICLNENAPVGAYSILITAKNNGVDICYNEKCAFAIVTYNGDSTYIDYIADEDVTLDTGLFVAAIVNDTQVEELREELREKIAETEASKAAYDQAADNLIDLADDLTDISQTVENAVEDAMQGADVAKQGTDPTATLTAIKSALDNMDISNVAKQGDNPNATNTAILAAFGNIDFSTLAKQGVNSAATNTAILSAITSIDLSSLATLSGQQSAAADLLTLKTRIGEATDATTANTLFGKIAAVLSAISGLDITSLATEANATSNKNAVLNDIAAKASAILGTDTTATLTALKTAIAGLNIPTVQQIQSGLAKTSELPTDYAKQGSNPTATNTAMNTLIGTPAAGQQPTLFQAIAAISGGGGGGGDVQISAADWTALITAVNQLTGSELVYADTAPDITTAITALRNGVIFANVAEWWSLPTLLCERKTIITAVSDSSVETVGDYAFQNATALTSVNLPNAITIGQSAFQSCSALTSVSLSNCTFVKSQAFYGAGFLNIYLPNVLSFDGSTFWGSKVQNIYMPKATSFSGSFLRDTYNVQSLTIKDVGCLSGVLYGLPYHRKLYRIYAVEAYSSNLDLSNRWSPAEAVDANSTSLVPQQEWDIDENGDPIDCTQFTSNRDKFLYCFKHLFMPAFGTVSSATLTLKSTVYDVVMADNEVSTYFSTHGWIVARVA